MSDAYGTLQLYPSTNLVCDEEALTKALNQYGWCNCPSRWSLDTTYDKKFIYLGDGPYSVLDYPTVFPKKIKGVYLLDQSGRKYFVDDPTDDDFDYASETVYDDPSLEELALDLSQHIKEGEIEICTTSNNRHFYMTTSKLIVRSDGTAVRDCVRMGKDYEAEIHEKA